MEEFIVEDERGVFWDEDAVVSKYDALFNTRLEELQQLIDAESDGLEKRCANALTRNNNHKTMGSPIEYDQPIRYLVDRPENAIPEEILELLFQQSAHRWLENSMTRRGMNYRALRAFLIDRRGFMFGSCVLASLLGKDFYEDLDVMIPTQDSNDNHTIRRWARAILGQKIDKEEYRPREVCPIAAKANRDAGKFDYFRRHEVSDGRRLDVVETLDVDSMFACCLLNTDSLVYDGRKFLRLSTPTITESIFDFARDPRCRILDPSNCMAFEAIYDVWCELCREGNCGAGYLQRIEQNSGSEEPVGLAKMYQYIRPVILSSAFNEIDLCARLPAWVRRSGLWESPNLDLKTSSLLDEVQSRYRGPKLDIAGLRYFAGKTFFRAVKLWLRGIECQNFDEIFDPTI